MKFGITYHEKFKQYDLGPGHPFRGDRFENVKRLFEEKGIFRLPNVVVLRPEPAKREDLLLVHEESYVDYIFELARESRPYDIETPVSPTILEAALLIIGGSMSVAEKVYKGELRRGVSFGGGLHHAGKNYGGGFCFFNDVAIAVQHLRKKFHVKRILIVDYDVHFGNGTSDIFYSDPQILFISIHQDPRTIYPGTGFIEQVGKGAGEGFNVNIPLPPGTADDSYLRVVREIVVPLAEEFKPEIILANGGSDPHFADSLGRLALSVNGFFELSRTLVKLSERVCNGKLTLMVGSGYNPEVLPICWYALTAGVIELESLNIADPYPPPAESPWARRKVEETLRRLKAILSKYWKCFG
ncbi:MAG TPA: histone deacetylase [Candidatus Bathyarchaeota archaeon]|nr:histone deacetylase [Candidatus Bathyarchaeota archaeon]